VSPPLFTASWSCLHTALRVAPSLREFQVIRTSRGLPRFWPEAERFPYLELLAPDGWMFGVWEKDQDKGDRCYRRKLHIAGLARVQAALDEVSDGRPQVLACFEEKPIDCHRGQFALWWQRKTNERVPELSLMQSFYGATALVYELELNLAKKDTTAPCAKCPQNSGAMGNHFWPLTLFGYLEAGPPAGKEAQ
jgi:hypothetical protein